jgi:hypothetical protein
MMDVFSAAQSSGKQSQPALYYRQDDRMAGSVPVWAEPKSEQERIAAGLVKASAPKENFAAALAYADKQASPVKEEKPFGFFDLIDMINPLQHIPVVSFLYRSLTGDEIRPISRIVGGALFTGGVGAATGLVDAIVENETGKDMTGNVVSWVTPDTRTAGAHKKLDTLA